ncbi:MAG: serine protease [Acidobacteria bacterium]|nr:serine protease [Acidobacteriota bacterium]
MATWSELSNEIAEGIQSAGRSIVSVQGDGRRTAAGIVLDDSTILTSAQGISEADNISVWISRQQPLKASLLGRDHGSDLALLKIDGKLGEPALFADSPQLALGQLVVAVARTWRGNLVASSGILSGLMGEWQTHGGKKIEAFIRPDLTLYPGFSGGALLGADRKIIGMTTRGLARGSSLAVPYATIKRITALLRDKGYVPSPYLGVGLQPVRLPESLRRKLNLSEHAAALVVHLEGGSPADHAGLMLGDILLAVADTRLGEERTVSILSRLAPDQKANIEGIRGDELFNRSVVIGERPRRQG